MQDPDTLRGRVVRGGDASAAEGLRVVLHRITSDGGSAVDSALSGPEGRFAFPIPRERSSGEGRDGPLHLATARYDGVLYFGPAVHGGDSPDDYRIEVYPAEPASDPDRVAFRSRTFVLDPDGEGMRVMDIIVARGRPGRTLVGPGAGGGRGGPAGDTAGRAPTEGSPPGPDSGRAPWWTVAVPASARDVRVLPGAVDPGEVEFGPEEARVSAVIPPSGQRVVLGYRLPPGSSLELASRHRVERVEVVAPEGARLRVPGGRRADPLEVQGTPMVRYSLEDRRAGDTLRVVFADGAASGGGRETLGWIAVGAGVLLLAAAGWAWRRRRASRGRGVGPGHGEGRAG